MCLRVCVCASVPVCVCGLQLSWQGPDGATAPLTDNIISDLQISTLANLNDENSAQNIPIKHTRASLLQRRLTRNAGAGQASNCEGSAALPYADHSVSHSVITTHSISDDILIFVVEARLQCLPTKYKPAIWYPSKHNPYCIFHLNQQENETVAQSQTIITKDCVWPGRTDRLTWVQSIKRK